MAKEALHAVQYMTCDHSCAMKAGLISESVRSVWRAVKNDSKSEGDVAVDASGKSDCKGLVVEEALALAELCLRDEKPPLKAGGDNEPPNLGLGGEAGGTRVVLEGTIFFLLEKGRKKDHSDSNWTGSMPLLMDV